MSQSESNFHFQFKPQIFVPSLSPFDEGPKKLSLFLLEKKSESGFISVLDKASVHFFILILTPTRGILSLSSIFLKTSS
jgi:hypothetical protein